jgi:stage III sporulation protein AH
MQIWKRNAVVSVIVLFVCVALYLSWSYGREADAPVFDPVSGLSADGEPLGSLSDVLLDPDTEFTPVKNTSYFDEARLSRRMARDTALSILNEAVDREGVSQDIRDNANVEITKMANNALVEANIENLILAKGFHEVVAIIGTDGISVVVAEPDGGMTPADAAIITDIVLAESTVSVADIKIVHVSV